MEEITNLLKGIITDLVNPDTRLQDILLKTQVLAYELNFEKLQLWVDLEINGYDNLTVPKYRILPAQLEGEVVQTLSFTQIARHSSFPLPLEVLKKRFDLDEDRLNELKTVRIGHSIAEIEALILNSDNKADLTISVPHFIAEIYTETFENAGVNKAWKRFSISGLTQILASVKSHLLKFLLELKKEIGLKEIFVFEKEQPILTSIFEKTIGNITVTGNNNTVLFDADKSQITVTNNSNLE